MTLLYGLGYEDDLLEEGVFPEAASSEERQDLFDQLLKQPAARDIAKVPQLNHSSTIDLHSNVLGCAITAHVPNDKASLYLAEAVLASQEALLATSLSGGILPFTSELHLEFKISTFRRLHRKR